MGNLAPVYSSCLMEASNSGSPRPTSIKKGTLGRGRKQIQCKGAPLENSFLVAMVSVGDLF